MSFESKLKHHIDAWRNKKIITEAQRKSILKDIENQSTNSSFFTIIAVIGALFIGVGAILLISSNWAQLPKIVKLILILSMPLGGLGIGYYLSYIKHEYSKIGDSLILLGSFLIGASIALLGQLYNIDGSFTGLLTWWFVLTIPITFLFRFRTLGILTIALGYISLFNQMEDANFFEDHIRASIAIFTFLPAIIIGASYYTRTNYTKAIAGVLEMFEIVSIKVMLIALFAATFNETFYFLGDGLPSAIFQNGLFLAVVFYIMWLANNKYNKLLRNSTFLWIAAFMIAKYFDWLWNYMEVGTFFVLFGVFLMLLVYGYIKGTKYLEKIKHRK